MVDFIFGFTSDVDADRGNRSLVTEEGNTLSVTPVPFTAGGVTGVTATAPLLSSGGAAPNISSIEPSRVYGQGVAATLTTTFVTIATASLVPSNTGKLFVSIWGVVKNTNGEVERHLNWQVTDGTHTLFSGPPITVAPTPTADGTATFAASFDSDIAPGTPFTYPLSTLVTLFLQLSEDAGSDLTVVANGTGLLVKENFN